MGSVCCKNIAGYVRERASGSRSVNTTATARHNLLENEKLPEERSAATGNISFDGFVISPATSPFGSPPTGTSAQDPNQAPSLQSPVRSNVFAAPSTVVAACAAPIEADPKSCARASTSSGGGRRVFKFLTGWSRSQVTEPKGANYGAAVNSATGGGCRWFRGAAAPTRAADAPGPAGNHRSTSVNIGSRSSTMHYLSKSRTTTAATAFVGAGGEPVICHAGADAGKANSRAARQGQSDENDGLAPVGIYHVVYQCLGQNRVLAGDTYDKHAARRTEEKLGIGYRDGAVQAQSSESAVNSVGGGAFAPYPEGKVPPIFLESSDFERLPVVQAQPDLSACLTESGAENDEVSGSEAQLDSHAAA